MYNMLMQPESPQQTTQAPQGTPGWQYKPGAATPDLPGQEPVSLHAAAVSVQPVQWSASEFIDHQKNFGWYLLLAGAALFLTGALFVVTHDKLSAGIMLAIFIIFGVGAARRPRTLTYQVDGTGIHIGSKSYAYREFRSYSTDDDGVAGSIDLMPLKRFMPPISLYFDRKDEPAIIQVIGGHLPLVKAKKDTLDRFLLRIRF